ncbi:hypothetical protein MHTCC0001_11970 [Flavobacteriaceae bacterium MHTCC 0001]
MKINQLSLTEDYWQKCIVIINTKTSLTFLFQSISSHATDELINSMCYKLSIRSIAGHYNPKIQFLHFKPSKQNNFMFMANAIQGEC